MGIKEIMFESMMGSMSREEKKEMMDAMMEKFFAGMSAEEKQDMMSAMMQKFMGSMNSNGTPPMAGMMAAMMGGRDTASGSDPDFNPMELCRSMMQNIQKASENASFATPEVRALFNEWSEQIEAEILDYINLYRSTETATIAEKLKLSQESVSFFLSRMAQKGKIRVSVEKC